jgi:hypothetical protein
LPLSGVDLAVSENDYERAWAQIRPRRFNGVRTKQ